MVAVRRLAFSQRALTMGFRTGWDGAGASSARHGRPWWGHGWGRVRASSSGELARPSGEGAGGSPEMSRWRQPPVTRPPKHTAPAGAAEGHRDGPPPMRREGPASPCWRPVRGARRFLTEIRWLTPPADLRRASGSVGCHKRWIVARIGGVVGGMASPFQGLMVPGKRLSLPGNGGFVPKDGGSVRGLPGPARRWPEEG